MVAIAFFFASKSVQLERRVKNYNLVHINRENKLLSKIMATYSKNNNRIRVYDSQIKILDKNNGDITVVGYSSNITSIRSNFGIISVPEASSVASIKDNTGNISLNSACSIGSVVDNIGCINLNSGCNIGTVKDNMGNIDVNSGCSIGSVRDNNGIIDVKNGSTVDTIEDNFGTINIGSNSVIHEIKDNCASIFIRDNCRIDIICDNMETIQLGNGCTVGSVIGTGGNIQRGHGCRLPDAVPKKQTPSASYFSGVLTAAPLRILQNGRNANNPQQQSAAPSPLNQPTPQQVSVNEELLCAICMENKKDIAFNCGHTCCANCSGSLWNCHICRAVIEQKIKLFL